MLEMKTTESGGVKAVNLLGTLIFDSHAHFDDEAFDEDRDALLASLREQGVGYVVNVTASLESLDIVPEMAGQYDFLYGTAGVHPNETGPMTEADLERIENLCRMEKIVAIGEIGLDYYWDEPERDVQKKWFIRQLELAERTGLPVVIHSRDAAKDTLDIMKEFQGRLSGGVIHCFSYGVEIAREYLDMGYYLGIGGVLTFKNAKKLKEVAGFAPLERIVLETDSPYLSPEPFRGKRNDSTRLKYVVEHLSKMKHIPEEEVIRQTTENAMKLYGMERTAVWRI